MKKVTTAIVATALLFVFLLCPPAVNKLLAAGIYTITSADGKLTLNDTNIIATGTTQRGLEVSDHGVVEMTGGSIKTSGYQGIGVSGSGYASITLTDVDVEMTSWNSVGIQVGDNGTVIMNGGSVSTINNNADAFMAYGGSQLFLTDVAISTTGVSSTGVFANNNNTVVNINGGTITTLHRDHATGTNSWDGSYGVLAKNSAVVNLTNVAISTNKEYTGNVPSTGQTYNGSYGLDVFDNGTINMTGGSINTNTGRNGYGVYASGTNARANLSGVSVTTGGEVSFGLYAKDTKTGISADNVIVHTAGNNSHGLFAFSGSYISADNISVTTSGDSSHGLRTQGTNSYISADNVSVSTSGEGAHGVVAESSSTIYLKNASIETTGENATAVYAGNKVTTARIVLNGATISADNTKNAKAIHAAGTPTNSTLTTRAYVLAEEAVYNIHGEILADNNSSIDITMADGSVFTGYTNTRTLNYATQNIRINGASSVWNISEDSVLTNLTLNGGSTVNFYAADALGTVIITDNLNDGTLPASMPTIPAGGIFIMKADIERERADNLVVDDTAAGSHYITVAPDGKASTTGKELTTLVVVRGQDNSNFALTSKTVDAGAWTYALRQRTNALYDGITVPAIWELYAVGASDPGSDAVNTFYGAYLLGYAETNTLIQRLGDLRATPHEDGLWFRVHGGKFETNSKNYVKGFDMDYGGVHVGYDRKLENIGWDGDAYAGIYAGYTRGELDYTSHGDATIDSKMIGAYATFIKPNGFFLDAIIKYHWMENEFNSFDSAGDRVTANDVNTGGLGFSVEVGQRIPFGREQKTGWYIEPQVQLSYQRYGDGTYECVNGLRVSVDGFTSILGRLGALIGYETEKSNLYAKIARIREFDGEVNAVLNNSHIREDFGGSWWVYGIGYTSRLNEKNSIYMDIERTSGASFKQEWSARAGWRVVF